MSGTRLRELKRRIASTRQIHQVTSALQRVAAARLGRDRQAILGAQSYTRKIVQLTWRVSALAATGAHPLMLHRSPVQRRALLVFGADRGLCGSFNTDLMNALDAFLVRHPAGDARLVVMGSVVERRARRRGLAIDRVFPQPTSGARSGVIQDIADFASQAFLDGTYDEVHVLYSRFAPALRQVPLVEQLLPTLFESTDTALAAAEFEPSPEGVLNVLLPEFVYQSIDHAFLNSIGAENAARQTAMSRASRNAGDMISELSQEYSHVRQEDITTEMLELAGGGDNR